MFATANTLSVCNGGGGNNDEEEDMRCFFCHETAFHVPALAAYRLCGCPASPLICAYCCLSSKLKDIMGGGGGLISNMNSNDCLFGC